MQRKKKEQGREHHLFWILPMVRHILAKFSTSLLKFRLPVTSPIQMVHFFLKKKNITLMELKSLLSRAVSILL